ncbi:MAG: GNAT family N-acetyltransferase [Methylobacteriaceae bacterium]|nr:GNAT family N-acetyltransferase [Methylobacteriaceae bacterium]
MNPTSTRILPCHQLSGREIEELEDRLAEHNGQAIGRQDGEPLAFVALDASERRLGALAGYSWAGCAEIKQLWVEERDRGRGIARGLLQAAVAEATTRGCQSIWTLSYTFQAPGFYERHGFERIAELADWPPGHAHVVLRRRLRAG